MEQRQIKRYGKFSLAGRLTVRDNKLFYNPARREKEFLPHRIELKGTWKLDRKHNLSFALSEAYSEKFGNTIDFTTRIERARAASLTFICLRRLTPTQRSIKRIKLKGSWKVNRHNQLSFLVKKEKHNDQLKFTNAWRINKDNQIIYSWRRKSLKKRINDSFSLRGSWSFNNNKLLFSLEKSQKPLVFRNVALRRKLIGPGKGDLGFSLAIGRLASQGLRNKSIITLSGKWRIAKGGIDFVTYSGQTRKVWSFTVKKKAPGKKEIALELINQKGEPLGLELTFRGVIFQDGHFFIRAGSSRPMRIEAGAYIPF